MKLHTFIKSASWSYPIAFMSVNSINIINTLCSIASFYGVGLEVIRTDPTTLQDTLNQASSQVLRPELESFDRISKQAALHHNQISGDPFLLEKYNYE